MKKILIYTVSTGSGHNQIAKYIKSNYERQSYEVVVLDFFKDNKKTFRNFFICKGYDFLIKYFMYSYNYFYKKLYENMRKGKKSDKSLFLEILLAFMKKTVLKNISKYEPDLIVCTHVFPSYILSELKKDFKLNVKVFAFITDLYPHPFWQYCISLDKYFVLSHTNKDILQHLKIKKSKIDSYRLYCKQLYKAQKPPNFDKNTLTLVIVTKNCNKLEFKRNLRSLNFAKKKLDVFVLCGGDLSIKKLCEKEILKNKNSLVKIKAFLYASNLELKEYLKRADIILSKAGINIFYESLKNNCVIIPFEKIAYNEKQNKSFLQKFNLSPKLPEKSLIKDYINEDFFKKDNLEKYKKNIYNFLVQEEKNKDFFKEKISEICD